LKYYIGLVALNIRTNGADAMYYVHTDHLGSLNSTYNSNGSKVYEQSFDAWGRKRNPTNWLYTSIANPPTWLIRGYTGHEMLPQFGLINMNAHIYDPLLAHVLSPDNYVQAPDYTQSYNRFTYCFNNPLKYTDPSGSETEDWYKDNLGNPTFNPSIHSQQDLNTQGISGTYIGQTAQWLTSGGMFASGDVSGRITQSPFALHAVTITPTQTQSNWVDAQGGGGRNYGGDGSGSFMDNAMYVADQINQFNPIANAWDAVTGYMNVTDRLGNPQSNFETTLKAASIIPIGKIGSMGASAIEGVTAHGVNQAITRGFTAPNILQIVRQGTPVSAMGRYGPQIRYTLGGNTVVVNQYGKVVSTYSNFPGTRNGLGQGFFIPFGQ
jgi:RHS repeat-associated protein